MSTADQERADIGLRRGGRAVTAVRAGVSATGGGDLDAALARAAGLAAGGRPDEALAALDASLAAAAPFERVAAAGRREAVITVARAVLASAPLSARRLVECELELGERSAALVDLHAAALAATGEPRRAVAKLRARLASEPVVDARGRLALDAAALLRAQNEPGDAADLLETVALELDDILDTDPERFETFELQTRLLVASRRWGSLHAAYRRMVTRLDPSAPELQPHLAQMWKTMSDVSRTRLGDEDRAAEEASTAALHRARIPQPAL